MSAVKLPFHVRYPFEVKNFQHFAIWQKSKQQCQGSSLFYGGTCIQLTINRDFPTQPITPEDCQAFFWHYLLIYSVTEYQSKIKVLFTYVLLAKLICHLYDFFFNWICQFILSRAKFKKKNKHWNKKVPIYIVTFCFWPKSQSQTFLQKIRKMYLHSGNCTDSMVVI